MEVRKYELYRQPCRRAFLICKLNFSNDEEGGSFQEPLLKQKSKVQSESETKEDIPLGYTDGMIAQDLDRYYSQILGGLCTISTRLALRVRIQHSGVIPFSEQWWIETLCLLEYQISNSLVR